MGGAIIVVICIIGSIIWGIRTGKKRRDEMGELVATLGLQFSSERNYQVTKHYAFLDKLRQGSNRYAYNMISGTYQGHSVAAFDYHYETHSTDSKGHRQTNHHHFSFFILTTEKYCPELMIAKESFFSKITPPLGYDDIDIESHEFSKKFIVRSRDKKFAHDFCNARMIDHLLGHPDIHIEVDQNLLVLGLGFKLEAEQIETRLKQLIEIRNLMPSNFSQGERK